MGYVTDVRDPSWQSVSGFGDDLVETAIVSAPKKFTLPKGTKLLVSGGSVDSRVLGMRRPGDTVAEVTLTAPVLVLLTANTKIERLTRKLVEDASVMLSAIGQVHSPTSTPALRNLNATTIVKIAKGQALPVTDTSTGTTVVQPSETRAADQVITVVQKTIGVQPVDGTYGPKTHAGLRAFAGRNRQSEQQFDAAGPSVFVSLFTNLGLNNVYELNMLSEAWKAWKMRQTGGGSGGGGGTVTPVEPLLPPVLEEKSWFNKYWWAIALGVLGLTGTVVLLTRKKSEVATGREAILPPPPPHGSRATLLPEPVGRYWR